MMPNVIAAIDQSHARIGRLRDSGMAVRQSAPDPVWCGSVSVVACIRFRILPVSISGVVAVSPVAFECRSFRRRRKPSPPPCSHAPFTYNRAAMLRLT